MKRKRMWVLTAILALLYIAVLLYMRSHEAAFLFFPVTYPEGEWSPPEFAAPAPPRIEDVWLQAADGTKLHGWLCLPPAPRATLLYFHGNAGNLSHRHYLLRAFMDLGWRVLIVDYRGYGRSEGMPDEAGLYQDATAAWGYLTDTLGIPPQDIVIFGKSLGGGVATELATRVDAAGLIVQSSFTSIPDMARVCYPIIPKFAVRTQFNSLARIAKIGCPLLIVHGSDDEVIPVRMGRALFAAAAEPKTIHELPGAHHNDVYALGGDTYLQWLAAFVETCVPARR